MNKKREITVTLSKQTTSITLPNDLAKALQYFKSTRSKWVSWIRLHNAGVSDPAEAILELKKLGALIDITYIEAWVSMRDRYDEAQQYKYCGWHFDAKSLHNTTNPHKEIPA